MNAPGFPRTWPVPLPGPVWPHRTRHQVRR